MTANELCTKCKRVISANQSYTYYKSLLYHVSCLHLNIKPSQINSSEDKIEKNNKIRRKVESSSTVSCKGCSKEYTSRGISKHQKTCESYLQFLDDEKKNTVWYNTVYVWQKNCWQCNGRVNVIYNLKEQFIHNLRGGVSTGGDISHKKMKKLAEVNQVEYGLNYSKTMDTSYMGSNCSHCQALQGDFYLNHDLIDYYWVEGWMDKHLVFKKKTSPPQEI